MADKQLLADGTDLPTSARTETHWCQSIRLRCMYVMDGSIFKLNLVSELILLMLSANRGTVICIDLQIEDTLKNWMLVSIHKWLSLQSQNQTVNFIGVVSLIRSIVILLPVHISPNEGTSRLKNVYGRWGGIGNQRDTRQNLNHALKKHIVRTCGLSLQLGELLSLPDWARDWIDIFPSPIRHSFVGCSWWTIM